MMFERYFGEGSEWIPRDELSTRTRMNLAYLEKNHGFAFDDQARKAKFGWANSYLVFGTAPNGDEAVYERRETSSRGAGQTYIWVGGKRHRLQEFGEPPSIFGGVEAVLESLPRIREIKEEDARWKEDLRRRFDAFWKAREEAVKKDMEEVGTEDLSELEQLRLRNLLDVLYSTEEPPPPPPFLEKRSERLKRLLRYLTKEEKEEVKRLVREYRESYGV